jgi:CHAD domain-containing protein
MSFELKPGQSVRKNVRRIARKELGDALEQLTGTGRGSRDEAVHEVRKSLKKLRALLRLVRPAIGNATYRAENVGFRDVARPLTEVRDAKILIETLDGLIAHFKEHVKGRSFDDVRKALQANLRAVRKRVLEEQDAFGVTAEVLRRARERVKDWADVPNRWSSLGRGLQDVYRQARDAFGGANADPTVETLHEWRKQAKYLRYQLEVLRPLWPERLGELAGEADCMGELLGDDHDLAVLRQALTDDAAGPGDEGDREALLALIDRRRSELRQEAQLLGNRFFVDRPREFARRLERYWKAWRSQAAAERPGQPQPAPA